MMHTVEHRLASLQQQLLLLNQEVATLRKLTQPQTPKPASRPVTATHRSEEPQAAIGIHRFRELRSE